jgi:pilus assembly protein CpaC
MNKAAQRAILVRRDATAVPFLFAFGVITAVTTVFAWAWGRVTAQGEEANSNSQAPAPLRLQLQVGDVHPLMPEESNSSGTAIPEPSSEGSTIQLRIRAPADEPSISQPAAQNRQATVVSPGSPEEVWIEESLESVPAEIWVSEDKAAVPAKQTQTAAPQSLVQRTDKNGGLAPTGAASSPTQGESSARGGGLNSVVARAGTGDGASPTHRIVLETPGSQQQIVLRVRAVNAPLAVRNHAVHNNMEGNVGGDESPLAGLGAASPRIPRTTPSVLRLIRENMEVSQSWAVAASRPVRPFLLDNQPVLRVPAEVTPELARATSEEAVPNSQAIVLTSTGTAQQAAETQAVSSPVATAWDWPGRTSDPQRNQAPRSSDSDGLVTFIDNDIVAFKRSPLAEDSTPQWRVVTPRPSLADQTTTSSLAQAEEARPAPTQPVLSQDNSSESALPLRPVRPSIVGDSGEMAGQAAPSNRSSIQVKEFSPSSKQTPTALTGLQTEAPAVSATPAPEQPKSEAAATPFEIIEESGELTVIVRRSKLLRTQVDVYRTAVVDSSICDVVQFTPREISILGKSQGATHVTFWFQDDRYRPVTYLVRVIPDPEVEKTQVERYELLESHLAKLFPESKVDLIVVGDKLVVKGQARDAAEAAQIMAVIRGELVRGRSVAEGRAADPVGQEAAGQTLPAIQVINMLRIPGPPQVALKVKIAELNRTAARNFGVDMHLNFDQGKFLIESLLNISSGGSASVIGNFDGGDLQFGLHYLEEHGVVRLLSEPTLVTLSGRPATFIAGGEFAVPTAVGVNGVGAVTTDFRAYGAIITFLPTVLDKDLIRLEVAPEFSQIDRQNTVNGTPGLRTRAVTTTVEMREGQTLAIAGLLDDSMTGNNRGDLPIFNQIFGRRSLSRNETELIILVTPEIVHPMEPEEVPPLPGFDVTEPTNHEFYLKGHLEGRPTQEYDSTTWPRLRRRYNAGGPATISGPYGHGD